jgi:8-amino-7-oxononanoate synthase
MATVERFSHNSPDDLREVISAASPDAPSMLVLEGVYSMEGHIARLPEIAEIAEENGCFTVLDDAHGFGVLGRQGRGTVDHFGLNDKVDVICGSMSKSLASTGGFVAASREVIEYLRTNSKQTIFSAAVSPSQAAVAQASLEIMQTEPQHLERLWSNTRKYRAILKSARPRHLGKRNARRADRARLQGARLPVLEGAPRKGHLHRHVDRPRRPRRQGSHPHRHLRDAHR